LVEFSDVYIYKYTHRGIRVDLEVGQALISRVSKSGASFVRGLNSKGGATISGLESGARNKLHEETRK